LPLSAEEAGASFQIIPAVNPHSLVDSQLISNNISPLHDLGMPEEKIDKYSGIYGFVLK
jgi:hypothetical protein